MRLPQLVKESQGNIFSFHYNGKVCQGLVLGHQLYRQLMAVSSPRHLDVIYACCCQLSRHGIDIVVTVGPRNNYLVWVDLRRGEEFSPILPTDEVEPIEAPEIVISPARQPLQNLNDHEYSGFPSSLRPVRSTVTSAPKPACSEPKPKGV